MSSTPILVAAGLVGAAALGGLAWFLATRSDAVATFTEAPAASTARTPANAASPTTTPGKGSAAPVPEPVKSWQPPDHAPATVRAPADRSRYLALPDGTFAEPLNGVEQPKPFLWPKDVPFARIVGKELDSHGYWWYVHADGSKSTTYKGQNPLTGKEESVTMIANPKEPLPIRGEELPGPRNPGK